jgi:predicted AAA+ superfamily ATPase
MRDVADSLAGQAAVVPLLGLSGTEWAGGGGRLRRHGWKEFLWRGGFPGLWADPERGPQRDRWYQGYVATYLERDVRSLLRVGSLRDFERCLRACASRTAQMLNMADIARDVGVSAPTVREWLSVLQTSNQILLLQPYHRSLGKRLAKSPKLYFTDTGLAAYLMGYPSAEALWNGPHAGHLWENHVVAQWMRWRDWHEPSAALWYWRDQPGNEVDLLLERSGRLIAIECRRTERPTSRDARGIDALRRFYGASTLARAFIACTTDHPADVADGVTAVPGWTTWKVD